MEGGAVLRPHSTGEGGEPQGFGQGSGHGTRWREGGNKCTHLLKGNITETQNSNPYVHKHRQNNRTRKGRSEAEILFDRSLHHAGKDVGGLQKPTEEGQCRSGWRHVWRIREGRRGKHPPAVSAAPRGQLSGSTATPGLYPQGKREAEANLDSRPGG